MAGRSWWRDAVVYQIYVRSFADSDGDGVGDLAGARRRLPHVAELGADAVWLTPFYPSPMADGGYDVADFRGVDPLFGELADFDALLAEAHRLGLRVLVDLVPNHTSSEHPWFAEALRCPPGSAARQRYLFRDGRGDDPPNDWPSVFGGPAWTQVPDGQWYLHLFAPEQPDLNWRNPQVRAEFRDVLRFWLDRGADGFRVDVAHGMIKHPDLPDLGAAEGAAMLRAGRLPYFDQDEVHEIHREWRALLDSYPGERIGVAEAWAPGSERLAAYVRPDELHQAFNFQLFEPEWSAERFAAVIAESLATTAAVGATTTWVLGNHDVPRPVTRYGGGQRGLRRARAAALLSFALPGSVYVHQGEELGLPEVLDLPEESLRDPLWERSGRTVRGRDGCRVPLPWDGDRPPFGFSSAPGWLPQPPEWADRTVRAQRARPGSVLETYRAALALRRRLPELGDGELEWLPAPAGVLAFARPPGFACAVNFGPHPAELALPGRTLLRSDGSTEPWRGALPPDAAIWLDRS